IRSEQRIDERRQGARLREHDQEAEQHEDDRDGNEPVFLFVPQEGEELDDYTGLGHDSQTNRATGTQWSEENPVSLQELNLRGPRVLLRKSCIRRIQPEVF